MNFTRRSGGCCRLLGQQFVLSWVLESALVSFTGYFLAPSQGKRLIVFFTSEKWWLWLNLVNVVVVCGVYFRWLLTFRDAMAVRFSHYFISYLSELSCLLTGIANDSVITVTEPWRIEMPRSLVDVVVCWNKPMHRWLRVCKQFMT